MHAVGRLQSGHAPLCPNVPTNRSGPVTVRLLGHILTNLCADLLAPKDTTNHESLSMLLQSAHPISLLCHEQAFVQM